MNVQSIDATKHKADLAGKITPKGKMKNVASLSDAGDEEGTDTLINTRIETRRISGEHWTAGCGGRIISGGATHMFSNSALMP